MFIRSVVFLTVIITSLFCFDLFSIKQIAYADINKNIDWSWMNDNPKVLSSKIINGNPYGSCRGILKTQKIIGTKDEKSICITVDEGMKFGSYTEGNIFFATVGFPLDDNLYRTNIPCNFRKGCLYSQKSDMLIMQPDVWPGYKGLSVYKNFSKRLIKDVDIYGRTTGYNFDLTNPDYIFKNTDGYEVAIGGIAMSKNGQWLVFEICGIGIGLMNMDTLQIKHITKTGPSYGSGSDPTTELDIDNYGRNIAFMGINSGIKVIKVDNNCGKKITIFNQYDTDFIECSSNSFNTGLFSNNFFYAFLPKISEDGGLLDFFTFSRNGEVRSVSLVAPGYSITKLDYLAIGDSFTSGEGETDDKYYLKGTNDKFEKCHLSINSYPYKIADLMGINILDMASIACSGARMGDVVGDDYSYPGQGGRLSENDLNLNDIDIVYAKINAKYLFIPGRIHQETFVKHYSPKIITVSIGGNDAGLIEKLTACLSHKTCKFANTEKGREQTANEIKNLFPKLVKTYQKIHEDSPDSKIFVIGYPKVIDENDGCNLINGYMLDKTERRFMNESIKYLNSVISSASNYVGVKYVDIENSFGNKVLCGSENPSAMNAIRLGDDIAIINKLKNFRPIGSESFHPNPSGHTLISDTIFKNIGNLLTYSYCQNGNTTCPDKSVLAPEPSKYWILESGHNYPNLANRNFVFNKNEKFKRLILESKSLEPDSEIIVEIASEPRLIGKYKATNDGSLDIDIELPSDLDEGYHTVFLTSKSYSGEPIELYDVIYFSKKSNQIYNYNSDYKDDNVSKNGNIVYLKNSTDSTFSDESNNLVESISSSDSNGQVKGIQNENVIPLELNRLGKVKNENFQPNAKIIIISIVIIFVITLGLLSFRKIKV